MLIVAVIALVVSIAAVVVTFAFGKKQADATVDAARAAIRSADVAEASRQDSETLWQRGEVLHIASDLIEEATQFHQECLDLHTRLSAVVGHFIGPELLVIIAGHRDAMYAALQSGGQYRTQLALLRTREHPLVADATALLHLEKEVYGR